MLLLKFNDEKLSKHIEIPRGYLIRREKSHSETVEYLQMSPAVPRLRESGTKALNMDTAGYLSPLRRSRIIIYSSLAYDLMKKIQF